MIYQKALEFAAKAHAGQFRRYTNESYIEHPIRVAKMMEEAGFEERSLAVAVLHDVLEDCPVTVSEMQEAFGGWITSRVIDLTNCSLSYGNRAARAVRNNARLAQADAVVQSVKCADCCDNTPSIVKYDPKFAKGYLLEKQALIPKLTLAHPGLWAKAMGVIGLLEPIS